MTGPSQARNDGRVAVFLSYVEEDRALMTDLAAYLTSRYGGRLNVLHEAEIQPGDDIAEKRAEWIHSADIVLLAVTPRYLESNVAQEDVKIALECKISQQTKVVPLLLEETDYSNSPFATLKALLPNGEPMHDQIPEKAFEGVGEALIKLLRSESPGTEPGSMPIPELPRLGLSFRAIWLAVSFGLLIAQIASLGMHARQPAVSNVPLERRAAEFLTTSAIVGITAMAVIQLARRLFRIRGAFHRDVLDRWLSQRAMEELELRVQAGTLADTLDLPTELLTGQLSAIAEQTLEEMSPKAKPSALLRSLSEGKPFHEKPTMQKPEFGSETEHDRRTAIALRIQRNLDHFQIAAAATWRRYLLVSSMLLSMSAFGIGLGLFGTGAFIPTLKGLADTPNAWLGNFMALLLGSVLVALLGGFFATIARDVVAILEKLRR